MLLMVVSYVCTVTTYLVTQVIISVDMVTVIPALSAHNRTIRSDSACNETFDTTKLKYIASDHWQMYIMMIYICQWSDNVR